MYQAQLVTNARQIQQIAALSAANLKSAIDDLTKKEQGFLTWEYSVDLLTAMHEIAPSIIVTYHDEVAGYALTATHEMAEVHTEMKIMLNNLSPLTYLDKPINDYRYYMMGQICIAKEHRGKGIFDQLYEHHKTVYGNQYDFLLTEVSTSNHRSLHAHKKVGFETIHTYHDHADEWDVIIWKFENLKI